MTKKHFNDLSNLLAQYQASEGAHPKLVNKIANFCAAHNERFDFARFVEACNKTK